MLTVHAFSPTATIEAVGEAPALPADLAAEIELLWQAEQERRGKTLFDGRILSAVEIGAERISGYVVEYRRFIAQKLRPGLFPALRVRPVAVSGLLRCADGILFGRRAEATTQDAGMWELAPSGGLDANGLDGQSRADLKAQIMAELREEVGLSPEKVFEVMPFCLVEDSESHVIDIGMRLEAPGLAAEAVLSGHRESASGEYSKLAVVAQANLAEFLARRSPGIVPVSQAILHEYQRLSRKG